MTALVIDKGWLSCPAGAFVQLNSIMGMRVRSCRPAAAGFDAEVLVQGTWITIANFDDEKSAMERVVGVLEELKHLFRYGN